MAHLSVDISGSLYQKAFSVERGRGGVNFPSNFTVFSLHDDKFEVLIKLDKLS